MDKDRTAKASDTVKANVMRELSLDEMGKVGGGANFWFFDDERRKPKEKKNLTAEGK